MWASLSLFVLKTDPVVLPPAMCEAHTTSKEQPIGQSPDGSPGFEKCFCMGLVGLGESCTGFSSGPP